MKKLSYLLLGAALFALGLSGCVKYNGRESSNPTPFSIKIPSKLDLAEGQVATVNATTTKKVDKVNWTVTDLDIIGIDSEIGAQLVVHGIKEGTTTIEAATSYKGQDYKSTCNVTVSKGLITLDKYSLSMKIGDTDTLTATADPGAEIKWESDDSTVATVSAQTGSSITVKAEGQGSTNVTAFISYNGQKHSAKCLVSVARPQQPDDDPSDPIIDEEVTTYLVIGENGRYKGQPGKDIASLYLENTVEFIAKVGEDLPTKEDVTSTVNGSEFKYWQAYNGGGALTQYDKVPNARGKILYACFGGGEGSVTPEPDPEVPTGNITLYFAFGVEWTSPADEKVYMGTNNSPETFTTATKQADGSYKATVPFKGTVTLVNAYINQGGDEGKYFHPTTGNVDYNKMNSAIKLGDVTVVDGGTYTITMTGWHYGMPDGGEWTDGWFNYTFKEGTPDPYTPPEPPDPSQIVTLEFVFGIVWEGDVTVNLAINDSWTVATKQSNKYVAEIALSGTATSINCYLNQSNSSSGGTNYFHPYNGSYDKMDSNINMGIVSVTAGNTYVITFTQWHDSTHWEWEENNQHGWFDYTFQAQA